MPIDMVIWLLVIVFVCGALFALGILFVLNKVGFNLIAMLQSYGYFRVVNNVSTHSSNTEAGNTSD